MFNKRKSNLSFIRVIKNSSFDKRFLYVQYLVKTFLKIPWWQFLVPCSGYLLVSGTTLSCKTQNTLILSMLVYYNKNSFLLRSFSLMHCLAGLFSPLIKAFKCLAKHNFFISKFHFFMLCCSLILLLPNIISSEGLFKYATSISRYVQLVLGSFDKHFTSCFSSTCSDCTEGSG